MKLNSYKDRNGNIIEKPFLSEDKMRFMYSNPIGRTALKVLCSKGFANVERFFLSTCFSSLAIDAFVKKNGIDMSEYEPKKYTCFNDFFTRKIKEDNRIVNRAKDILISPSDGRASVYKIDDSSVFKVKNTLYSVSSLLRSRKLAANYVNGYFVLIRLCVDNYHRYTYCCDGIKSPDRKVKGTLHTVNPIVYDYVKVYAENTRQYCTILDEYGAELVQMEVGAMGVGRISNFMPMAGRVRKGEEKGTFEFGGSSIVLLIPAGSFVPDEDLIRNTAEGYETCVMYGEAIGSMN